MHDLDHLAVILAETRRNRQQLLAMLPENDRADPAGTIATRQLNQVLLHLGRACLDLRLVLDLAEPSGAGVILDIPAARR